MYAQCSALSAPGPMCAMKYALSQEVHWKVYLTSGFSLKCTHRSLWPFVARRIQVRLYCNLFENSPLEALTKSFLVIKLF